MTDHTIPPKRGGLRRLTGPSEVDPCQSPEHNPPSMLVYQPGWYEWECPACGHKQKFHVPGLTCWVKAPEYSKEIVK
jgi:hypothetical protein